MPILLLFRDPFIGFVLFFSAAIVANFVIASREAAILLSLKRNAVAGEAVIAKKRTRISGRGSPTFWVTYEFTEFATGKQYRRKEMVTFMQYKQWKVGDTVKTT